MKCQMMILLSLMAAFLAHTAWAVQENPVTKVLLFLEELEAELTGDMKKENDSFNAFSVWCTETIAAAKTNIAQGEETIETCKTRIEQLSASSAKSGAEIAHTKASIVQNTERTNEAIRIRDAELKEYVATEAEMKASIEAMTKALQEFQSSEVTSGETNVDASGFLQQKISARARLVRKLLHFNVVSQKLEPEDLQALTDFAALGRKMSSKGQEFLQLDRDAGINEAYQSGSGQVIAIIEETKGDFEKDLEELTEDEQKKVTAFNQLKQTMTNEKAELQQFLDDQTAKNGESVSELTETTTLQDETEISLTADKKLLKSTETTCDEKTYQFGLRKKLRNEELQGVSQALAILSSDNATATFDSASAASFAQLQSYKQRTSSEEAEKRQKAYEVLHAAASKTHDLMLAQIALQVTATGYFDKVIDKIDAMLKHLKEEEKEDVEHRDRCLKRLSDSKAQIAEYIDQISKAETKLLRMNSTKAEMQVQLAELDTAINETKRDIAERQAAREQERSDHLVALQHDTDALELIEQATAKIVSFFNNNNKVDVGQKKWDASLVQKEKPTAPDRESYENMPDAGFESAGYEGATSKTKGAVRIMQMIKEDMESEIKTSKADDAENQQLFEKDYKALTELLDSQENQEISTTKALANLEADMQDKKEFKEGTEVANATETERKETLQTDCAWVQQNFQSRREKRKAEMDSLVEAKGLLYGAEP
eukprot:TRINITY_DN10038_c0_g1_i1.p1 TRINITY_DN10038_c0_g1~~TRINITY_DN10038_c0_g1_i1.p1  ORF type:complete len:716 (+),score=229.14 TRINITY_DN10038_c0_g1_i1:126-2273(+)